MIERLGWFKTCCLAATALSIAAPAIAQAKASPRSFDIPAQSLARAILAFSRQSGVVVVAPSTVTREKQGHRVHGLLPPDAALGALLSGSGLRYQFAGGGYVLERIADTQERPVSAAAPTPDQAGPGGAPPPQPISQDVPTDQQASQEITVTGTRLQTGSFTSPTPVTAIDSAQVTQRSAGSVFEIVKDIPSFRSTSGPSANSTGAQNASKANLDLRSLGASRTLVLVNSRRHVADGTGNVWDTNLIPASMIERVDVVTGGASAAYGSDAVAGVVNFVLKNRFEGFTIEAREGVSEYGDNQEFYPSFLFGKALFDGKVHVVVGGDLTLNQGVGTAYSRSWGLLEPGALSISASAIPNRVALGIPANIIANHVETSAYNASGLITSSPLKGTAFADGGVTYPFQYGAINGGTEMIGTGNYGSIENPDQFLRAPYERGALLARIEWEVTPTINAWGSVNYGVLHTHGRSFGARVPNFSNYPVLITNPFLPAQTVAAMKAAGIAQFTYSATRHDDLGSIESHNHTNSFQSDFGVNGTIFGNWKWDVGGDVGSAAFKPYISNTPRTADFYESAYVVPGPNGQPICGPVATNPYFNAQPAIVRAQLIANLSPNCVPYNIFGTNADQNQGALAYFNSASATDFEFREYDASANLAGSPFHLPAGDVSFAIGGEWRRDTLSSVNCPDCQRGALANQNYSLFSGAINVKEGYAEASVPLIHDTPLIRSLTANGAIRRTDYSTSGAVTTWKVGGVWDVFSALRLRGTRSRDIRAPNINELFNPGSEGNPNVTNIVNGASGFIKSNTVGNPSLKPEISDSYTFGAVFQPKWYWASGFRMSADYWNINLKGVIATLDAQTLLNDVLRNPNSPYAQYVVRDTSAVGVSRVNVPQLNLNALKTDGIDFELDYVPPIARIGVPGKLGFRALGTWIHHSRTVTLTTDIDQAGTAAAPDWSWNIQTNYSIGQFSATLMTRYTSPLKYSATLIGPDDPRYDVALPNSVNQNIWRQALYFNTYVSYTFKTPSRNLRLYFNVDNIANTQPPVVAISVNGSPWDLVGRSYKVGAQVTF